MSDDNFGIGLFLGSVLVGVPLAIGAQWFSDRSYKEGLKGKELVNRGPIFGRTSDSVLVFVSKFDEGREVRLSFQNLESRVYQLERALSELKAGYIVTQGKLVKLESEITELWGVASKFPEMRSRLEKIYMEIVTTKNGSVPYLR